MAFSKEIQRLPGSAVRVDVKIDGASVRASYDREMADYCKKVQLPGFRKGKVPRNVIERKFGNEIKTYLTAHIIEETVHELLESGSIPDADMPIAMSQPRLVDEEKIADLVPDFEAGLAFAVTWDVMPKVEIKQWKGLSAAVNSAEVTKADIDRSLAEIQERNAIMLDKTEGAAAEKGDVVTVNYCELENGRVKAATEREDFVCTLGKNANIYHFDDEIIGLKVGEERDFDKSYPENYEDETLRGKNYRLRVKLTKLQTRELPALDDEFAQDVDENFKTLADLQKSVKERLEKRLAERLAGLKTEAIIEKIMAETPVEVPESMIRFESERQIRDMFGQYASSDVMAKIFGDKSGKDVFEPLRAPVTKALHAGLVQNQLIKDLGITVTDEDVAKKIDEAAAAYPETEKEKIADYYKEGNARDMIEDELKHEKLRAALLAENTFTVAKKVSYEDIFKNENNENNEQEEKK